VIRQLPWWTSGLLHLNGQGAPAACHCLTFAENSSCCMGMGVRPSSGFQPHIHLPGTHAAVSVIFDGDENLYGTTQGDGVTTFGSVFEITL
jgi:hypothetical protein